MNIIEKTKCYRDSECNNIDYCKMLVIIKQEIVYNK